MIVLISTGTGYFNPRAPCGARRPAWRRSPRRRGYFNPRAPCGARLPVLSHTLRRTSFQPTRPLRGATFTNANLSISFVFQPTRPLRGATHQIDAGRRQFHISTHAPLAGRDDLALQALGGLDISTHAPLAGRDQESGDPAAAGYISTHAPLAGRDPATCRSPGRLEHFNPRAPCGARRPPAPSAGFSFRISTHAPLAGRDSKSVQITMHIFAITDKFQMLLHRMPPVRAFCSFLTQENHADLGANRPSDLCALVLRTIRSSVPRADTSACSRSVRFYSRTSCPSSKIEGCPFLGQ